MDGAESLAVDERSATYNIHKRYPIDRDHSHMVKFESRYDIYYSIVRNHIIQLLEQPLDESDRSMEKVANQRSEPSTQGIPRNERAKVEQEHETEVQEEPSKEKIREAQTEREGRWLRDKRFWRRG